ncbi:ubiquitin-like small modifier protein 1 [Haloglomus halophilum]|uniref:ubiquitin-like small modifier protein 1 n=1 Tax=Haloglomus halophilum TaxID=2962672 RepID=UPI0020C9BB25|nr:ubiquitin-like small modifier protein 1 [Haloglomus halophilum]
MAGDDETVTLEFYGTVRDAVGEKVISLPLDPGTTVNALLEDVAAAHPDLHPLLFTSEERLRPHINVSRNGEPIRDLDGPDTELGAGDRVTVAPSVSGGVVIGRAERPDVDGLPQYRCLTTPEVAR